MENNELQNNPMVNYDIVICGGGVAGLWLLNVLIKKGFDVLLLEKVSLGGIQTMASQGMIHGGQKYMLGKNSSKHAENVAILPSRWDACLKGTGELDLSAVRVLSKTQVMWPTGGLLTHFALSSASHVLKAQMRKLDVGEVPKVLKDIKGISVLELPEKVLDVASLVEVLSVPHKLKIKKGEVDAITRDGCLRVSGLQIKAQVVICAAGLGNEKLLALLHAGKSKTQRRPLRQFMVKPMPYPLYGHGITTSYKPSLTVTSHPLPSGEYVWYLGGGLAEDSLSLIDDEAIAFAKSKMKEIFSHLDWSGKLWSTWYGLRAEAHSHNGQLPSGPILQEYGNALVTWPTKLTLAPLLGDLVLSRLMEKGVFPNHSDSPPKLLNLDLPPMSAFPWDHAIWS